MHNKESGPGPDHSVIRSWDYAIEHKRVPPNVYAAVAFSHAYSDEAAVRYQDIRNIFEKEHGEIIHESIAENLWGAVTLTNKGKLCLSYTPEDSGPLNRLIFLCADQAAEIERLLRGDDLSRCQQKYSVLMGRILNFLEELKSGVPRLFARSSQEEVLSYFEDRKRDADTFFERALKRRALVDYFFGMVVVAGATLVSGTLAWLALSGLRPLILSLMSGAIGPVISVLTRMTREKLEVETDAGRMMLGMFGAFRVVVGSILGLVVYCMLESGILPVKLPVNSATSTTAFFATLSFVAGFAEREVQGVIESTARKFFPNKKEKDS